MTKNARPSSPADQANTEVAELAAKARKRFARFIARKRRLLRNLQSDLEGHGDAETWRRYGDLLLANLQNAIIKVDTIAVTDYYDDAAPTVEIPLVQGLDAKELAGHYYKRATRARRARAEIERRSEMTVAAILQAEKQLFAIDVAEQERNIDLLRTLAEPPLKKVRSKPLKVDADPKRFRRFVSSDGYEILVGKTAADNDHLTFRISNSLDIWLHAADHPGSHVIVRIPKGVDVPIKTLCEAAQLAAFYSTGKEQPKLEVRYTQRKFVSKPKNARPGLVSISRFKSLLVEPKVPFERDDGP